MTPEERFTKIENLLHAITEHQAHHAEQLAKHAEQLVKHDEEMSELRELQKAMATGMIELREAHLTGSRRFEEGMSAVHATLRRTAEQQQLTEEKLHALIDTVDRIIRNQGGQT